MMNESVKTHSILAYVETFGLWLATAVLAFYEILVVRNLVFDLYARLLAAFGSTVAVSDHFWATALGQASVYVMVFVAIAVIIGGFEYHYKRVGDPRSRKLLLWTLGIQAGILLLSLIV
jgi:hypothetical protein